MAVQEKAKKEALHRQVSLWVLVITKGWFYVNHLQTVWVAHIMHQSFDIPSRQHWRKYWTPKQNAFWLIETHVKILNCLNFTHWRKYLYHPCSFSRYKSNRKLIQPSTWWTEEASTWAKNYSRDNRRIFKPCSKSPRIFQYRGHRQNNRVHAQKDRHDTEETRAKKKVLSSFLCF